MGTLRIGTASAGPSQKSSGLLKVAEHLDGSSETIPVVVANGHEDGPCLWVMGCEHGDEMLATATLIEFVAQLEPEGIRGSVVVLPVLNSTAFNVKQRYSPLDHFNFALGWPGIENGWLSQQIAYKLFGMITEQADCVINMHNGLFATMNIAPACVTYYESEEQYNGKLRGFVESFLFERIIHWVGEKERPPTAKRSGAMIAALLDKGIPSFVTEVGPDMENGVPAGLRGLSNAMKYLEMQDGTPEFLPKYKAFYDNVHVFPTRGGLFAPKVKLGQPVEEGDVLATIKGFDGQVSEILRAPADGEVLVLWKAPLIGSGDESAVDMGLYERFDRPWPREG